MKSRHKVYPVGLSWSPTPRLRSCWEGTAVAHRMAEKPLWCLQNWRKPALWNLLENPSLGVGKADCRVVNPRGLLRRPSWGSSFQQMCWSNWILMCKKPQTKSQNPKAKHCLDLYLARYSKISSN